MKRLFKINWSIPYAKYETYLFGDDEEQALLNFNLEIQKEVATYNLESILEIPTDGVIVTKYIK
ncbi:hypothetical protein [Paenibacillus lautus]|uniref:hypothetical protein n=1 Tax=Paenibacillus lautus TaxID=1401 RepID=UPI001C7D2C28|nr:hypothetical protein [Paenibacillus lautus]MBX4152280.1 hypothetical protein [Paenibacillus lautus]